MIKKELKCPKCGSVFSVDEADYASIVSQVKNAEFEEELHKRLEMLLGKQEAEQKVKESQTREAYIKHQIKRAVLEGQPFCHVRPDDVDALPLPPGNKPFAVQLRLGIVQHRADGAQRGENRHLLPATAGENHGK